MWITDEPALKSCPKCGWKGYAVKTDNGDLWIICSHCDYHTAHHEFDPQDAQAVIGARLDAIGEWNGQTS